MFKTIDGHRNPVDLKNADIYVIIEVFKNLLVLAIIPKYRELKKYNLSALSISNNKEEDV